MSCTSNDNSFVPTGSVAPIMLQLIIVAQHDDFQIEAKTALHERRDRADVMAERRALAPEPVAGIRAPPMLHLPAGGDAELEVSNSLLIRGIVLALDHAGRAADPAA